MSSNYLISLLVKSAIANFLKNYILLLTNSNYLMQITKLWAHLKSCFECSSYLSLKTKSYYCGIVLYLNQEKYRGKGLDSAHYAKLPLGDGSTEHPLTGSNSKVGKTMKLNNRDITLSRVSWSGIRSGIGLTADLMVVAGSPLGYHLWSKVRAGVSGCGRSLKQYFDSNLSQ